MGLEIVIPITIAYLIVGTKIMIYDQDVFNTNSDTAYPTFTLFCQYLLE